MKENLKNEDFDNSSELLLLGSDVNLDSISNIEKFKKIITSELEQESQLQKKGLNVIYFHRYAQSEDNWNKIVDISKEWLSKWPYLPLNKEKKSILELFRYEDVSLWWFVYSSIWETKNGIFDTIYHMLTISNLINHYKPKKITVYGNYDFSLEEVLKVLKNKHDFEYQFYNYSIIQAQANIEKHSTQLLFFIRFILLKIGKFFSKKKKVSMAIFLKHGISSILVGEKHSQIVLDHYVYGLDDYFIENNKNFLFVSLDMPRLGKNIIHDIIMDFIRTVKGNYVPWISYKKINDIKKFIKKTEHYSDIIIQLEKESEFKESMKIEDIDLFPLLKKTFQKNLPRLLAFAEMEIMLANNFQKKEKLPVFSTDLASPSGKALCFATKNQNLPIYAPQGGIISPQFPLNVEFFITEKFDHRLLPEFLVWGKHWEEIIKEKKFPSSLIKQVGFWSLKEQEEKISNDSDYVLFITGAHINKITYVYSFKDEIFTIKKIRKLIPEHLKLIIKIHPSLSTKDYEKALKKYDLIIVNNKNESNYPKLLQNAIVIVGKTSTLLIKALAMGKPIINVNFSSKLDFIGTKDAFVTNSEMFEKKFLEITNKKYQNKFENIYYNSKGKDSVNIIQNILKSCFYKNNE